MTFDNEFCHIDRHRYVFTGFCQPGSLFTGFSFASEYRSHQSVPSLMTLVPRSGPHWCRVTCPSQRLIVSLRRLWVTNETGICHTVLEQSTANTSVSRSPQTATANTGTIRNSTRSYCKVFGLDCNRVLRNN